MRGEEGPRGGIFGQNGSENGQKEEMGKKLDGNGNIYPVVGHREISFGALVVRGTVWSIGSPKGSRKLISVRCVDRWRVSLASGLDLERLVGSIDRAHGCVSLLLPILIEEGRVYPHLSMSHAEM